jgi:transcriptional regulator
MKAMPKEALPLIQGTLDLLVLRALAGGPMHGYGIAELVHERTGGELAIEDAALYQALHRLDRQDLVRAEWRASENNRRARYYALTAAGRKRLREQVANWRRYVAAVDALLPGV